MLEKTVRRFSRTFAVVSLFATTACSVFAKEHTVSISVTSKIDGTDVPVSVPIEIDDDYVSAAIKTPSGETILGQLTGPSLLAEAESREIHFVVPRVAAGETLTLDATLSTDAFDGSSFAWDVDPGKTATLSHSGRNVLKYMFERVDDSSDERRNETYKVYHHVFDPTGKFLVTKGPGGKFPHHRGLFFGFNRISYGDNQKADVWHCRKGESQVHTKFLATESGPVLGRHQVAIDWNGQDGKTFANEKRQMTAYHVEGGTLIEFASIVTPTKGPVRLDGDPQHAGFQFRGSQHIADVSNSKTYYLRPDGRGKPGEYRNWKNEGDSHANLPWNAQSFVIDDQRFTCCYLDRPGNPKESRFSERDYGRFGSYFEYDLTADNPLQLNYRIWLQAGEMTVDTVSAVSEAFVNRPVADLK